MNIQPNPGLIRLLQLCSANFPVGAYAFSQGLEWAVEAQWITDATALCTWLDDQLNTGLMHLDIPILLRFMAVLADDARHAPDTLAELNHWNHILLANRETAEFGLAEIAMGEAANRVARELALPILALETSPSFLYTFASIAHHWAIDVESACLGYLWSWLENQVAAGVKLIPLGQSQAQRVLTQFSDRLTIIYHNALNIEDADIGASLPGLAIASAQHETQYSRLFRS